MSSVKTFNDETSHSVFNNSTMLITLRQTHRYRQKISYPLDSIKNSLWMGSR